MSDKYALEWFDDYAAERKRLRTEQWPCFRWFGWPAANESYTSADESRLALYVAIAWCAPYRLHMLHLPAHVVTPTLFSDLRPFVRKMINRMAHDSKYMRETIAPSARLRMDQGDPSHPPPNVALGMRITHNTQREAVMRLCAMPGTKKFLVSGTQESVDLLPYLPHSRFAWQCKLRGCRWLNDLYLPARRTAVWCVACGKPERARGVTRNWTHQIGAVVVVYNGPRAGRVDYWRTTAIAAKHAGIRCVTMTGWGGKIRTWDNLFRSWGDAG